MARLYADENFPKEITVHLRELSHDVLTVQEADNRGLPDEDVLAFAISTNRAVLTLNRRDFFKLHKTKPEHLGIIACKDDKDWERLAMNISTAIALSEPLIGKLIRVNRQP
ncbi:DUF5615 family PIN-like protein [Phormidesmis priestleyi]